MNDLQELLREFLNEDLQQIVLSNTLDAQKGTKVKIRPILLKDELYFQRTLFLGKQVFHENLKARETADKIADDMGRLFRQCECKASGKEATVLVSKKGKMTIKVRRGLTGNIEKDAKRLEHNRQKQYILKEGMPADFLVGLGVQTPEGKVTKAKYDKFRQINRYLEFIEDVLDELPKDETIRIIDFGCGKSYLTFAMYYYLHELQNREIEVTGLDLKSDVIEHCNRLAQELHYDHLHFERGDISTYEGTDTVDMVVSLHACDTATDYALEKAIRWGAKVIMAVPCCQHEVNKQIQNDILRPVLKYGVLKERFSALVTDAVRANMLEEYGYDTQILEFIDMEHTPKNLLIRAVKHNKMKPTGKREGKLVGKELDTLTEFLQISPTLEKLLEERYEENNY